MRRLISTLGTALVVTFGVLLLSPAAHAADGTMTFTPSATTVNPGDTVTISWETTGVIDLELWGDIGVPNGPVSPTGSIDVQFDYPGTYSFYLEGAHEDEPDEFIEEEINITVVGDIITLDLQCGEFTVTNLLDIELIGIYGDLDNFDIDDLIDLGPNESQTVTTNRSTVDLFVMHEMGGWEEFNGLIITQNCGNNNGSTNDDDDDTGSDNKSGHPTVAPKAGVADKASMGPVGAVSLALLIGAGIAARRVRALN